MSIFYLFIAVPIIFMAVLSFMFSSSLTAINNNQFLANCPYPIFDGVATLEDIQNNQLVYSVDYGGELSQHNQNGTKFVCSIDSITDAQSANTIILNYGETLFDFIPYGILGYWSDYLTAWGQKAQANLTIAYLYINAPAEVSGLDFFTYMNGVFGIFIGLGFFMIVRGNGG